MNTNQAKEISLIKYLQFSGIEYTVKNSVIWVYSPFAAEKQKTPSLNVDPKNNIWFDHLTGKGGTIIDFVCLHRNCTINETLKIISGLDTNPPENTQTDFFSFQQQNEVLQMPLKTHIQNIGKNKALNEYLLSRCIPVNIAQKYLSEIYYTFENKQYFALAFKNDSNGYEIRNKYFKGCILNKDITSFKTNSTNTINLFEGFFDFLSAMVFFKQEKPNYNTIILNSVNQLNKITDTLQCFDKINCFFDNDKAGQMAYNEIKKQNSNAINQAAIFYPTHKDFNEFITKNK